MRRQAEDLATLPQRLRAAVSGLTPAQLETKYRNWTVRQIVHHLADSHANAYIRWKLAMTEESPRITPYNETTWAEIDDARTAEVAHSLAILEGIHARWDRMIRAMSPKQFERTFFHPERNGTVPLWEVLATYAWHSRHHPAQIEWMRKEHGWA